MIDPEGVAVAFLLTLIAGLSTCIGSLLVLFTRRTSTRLLSFSLGFSAGVMIYVSFTELLPAAHQAAGNEWAVLCAFFAGIAGIAAIDHIIPYPQNPHEARRVEEAEKGTDPSLYRTGLLAALAIALHNVPEGMATFYAATADLRIGVPIAVAIAIHNIPEGIAVSVPICCATGSRWRAFGYALISGLAEPAGALIAFLILLPFLSARVLGLLFASVAGIMIFVALDELLPAAREYGEAHLAVYGLVIGMGMMGAVLIITG
ncbi:zinc transporter ZupT [Methanofollis fontis]|uniref:Zinc transporter ZupT n=1 Tax=Methanofollis fontis TaxID=2052832 RepID=A0A483CVV2_9EURY|nr:zinc transporter ZupT [Methanofollis fontis]TAJ43645.1 zinc transporter ZupT [Methanofollis fontis]